MPNLDQSENPTVQRLNRLCQFYEITMLLGLTLLVCGVFVLQGTLLYVWSLVWAALAVASFFAATGKSYAAIKSYRAPEFVINKQRIATLRAVSAPPDAIECLEKMDGRRFVGEKKFFRALERSLGSERTREVKTTVFKYVRR